MILTRRDDRLLELLGRALDLAQHAVDAIPHDDVLLARPDMDIDAPSFAAWNISELTQRMIAPSSLASSMSTSSSDWNSLSSSSSFFVPSSSSAPPRSREYVLLMWSTILPLRRDHGLDRLGEQHADRIDHLDRVRIGDRDHHATVGVAADAARSATRELIGSLSISSTGMSSARGSCGKNGMSNWIASARAS